MKKFNIKSSVNIEENPTDRQERISWWSQEKLKKAKVMVVGAGAIGNETLKNLALLGIGNIFIVDFDIISTSNLSRTVLFRKDDVGRKKAEVAAKRIKELAFYDDINVDWFHGDLVWEIGTGIYEEMDLVLGCLDNVEARMSINKQCWLAKTPWIDSGMYELGMRVEFYNPPQEPCYQCNLTPQQMQNANKRYSCDQAKLKAFDEEKMPTTQITSAIVSGIQVQEAIKFLCGEKVAIGKKIYFQGKNNDFDIFSKQANPLCDAHASYPKVVTIPFDVHSKLKDLLTFISQDMYAGKHASLDFRGDRAFIKAVSCRTCFSEISFMRPTFRINADEFICENCKTKGKSYASTNTNLETKKITQEVFNLENTNQKLLNFTLHELGVPYMHIIAIINHKGKYSYFKLIDKTILKTIK
ncbi:Molybdopterin-synthase adenylyltransferase [Kordia antarctica]|uniref:Molybdopterin-synthase adenylyltransferase n=1 Tax=Kordia antarctica TaxID=1218801 RepID=A0A7L4ZKH1_9FLAO|nr:ThiF family adenylyltransferase [Kordia antarctica]QHI36424.1 Molybdopterin-synthase adenylyltransferase [Kordia antarctica]